MTDTVALAVRFALYLDLMLLFGVPLFGLYALRGKERAPGSTLSFRALLATSALVGAGLSLLALLILAASMGGVSLSEVDRDTVDAVMSGTAIGAAWQIRMVAVLIALCVSVIGWRRPTLALSGIVVTGAVALGSLAWTGHGAASEGLMGWVHLGADIVHLLSAGVWIGALIALALLIFRPSARMTADHMALSHRALDGFATTGTIVVALILLSGLINSWVLVGPDRLGALFTTLYGRLLVAKLILFVAMLGVAAMNRFRLTPSLKSALTNGNHRSAIVALRRSLVVETTCALAILGFVAWLGLLEPPAAL